MPSHAHSAPKSVLVYVGLDLVGDGLIKLPFVRALRQAYPEARITWLAGKGKSVYGSMLGPLVDGLLDEVVDDANVGIDPKQLFSKPLAGTALEGRDFDLLIDTQSRVKTTLIVRRIPHRTFISGALGFWLSSHRPGAGYRRPAALVRRLLDLVAIATGGPADPGAQVVLDATYQEAAKALLPDGPRYVGIAPGSSQRIKCWPLDRFAGLARAVSERGWTPVFLLGPNEKEWVPRLRDEVPGALLPLQEDAASNFGQSPLLTIALGARLAAAVANDSGTSHMLAAADTPLLSLFGPTSPEKFAPYSTHGRIVKAQDFESSDEMSAIPLPAVIEALEAFVSGLSRTGKAD